MPKPLPGVDWEFVKALYLQGLTYSAIAQKTGIKQGSIKSKSRYYDWPSMRSKAVAVFRSSVATSVHDCQALTHARQSNALAKASQIAQEHFAAELSDQTALLRSKKPTKLRDLANTPDREGRASVVAKLVSTAAKLYGWDQQSTQPQTLNLTQVNVSPDEPGPVIDVPPDRD